MQRTCREGSHLVRTRRCCCWPCLGWAIQTCGQWQPSFVVLGSTTLQFVQKDMDNPKVHLCNFVYNCLDMLGYVFTPGLLELLVHTVPLQHLHPRYYLVPQEKRGEFRQRQFLHDPYSLCENDVFFFFFSLFVIKNDLFQEGRNQVCSSKTYMFFGRTAGPKISLPPCTLGPSPGHRTIPHPRPKPLLQALSISSLANSFRGARVCLMDSQIWVDTQRRVLSASGWLCRSCHP